jgi:GT2 family glycosyltransferase
MLKTAVVILNWNGLGYLKKFLGNVVENSSGPGIAIFVADNGSSDGSAEWVSSNYKEVRLIRFEKNHGFAGGYNLALRQIDAKYYILLNSDIETTKGWIDPLVDYMDSDQATAACQPKILSWSRRDYFEYAGAAGGYLDKYGFPFCRGRIFTHVEKDTGQYDDQASIFWASGACMAVRADAWERCGGLDESFFAHMEEIDLCWRILSSGSRIMYIPGSVVYHVGGGSLPYESPFKTYLNFRNSLCLLYKNLDGSILKRTLFIRKVFDGIAAMMFLLKGDVKNFKAVWKAHIDYYRSSAMLKETRKHAQSVKSSNESLPVLNKSIVFEFYARGHKTFSSLQTRISK